MLKKAYVEITNRCNLACSFCPKTKREPRTMSAQEFGLVLSRLEGYVQYVYLHVMGEPLLHPELTTLFALAKARDMKICITTNGTLLQKRSDELLAAESLHKISVSLHSFEGNDGADEQELSYLTQVWNFAEKAAKKGVTLTTRFDAELPVWGDTMRLQQIVQNLVTNAIHYTPAGGTITVHSFAAEGRALVLVQDTGCGIAPEDQAAGFDRYFHT